MTRVGLILFGVIIGLGAGELGLRCVYPYLPSLMPVAEGDYALLPFTWPGESHGQPTDPHGECNLERRKYGRSHLDDHSSYIVGNGDAPPLRLTIAGDSVADGAGARKDHSYGHKLAEMLSKARGRPVEVLDTAIPGAGFCDHLENNHRAIREREPPDLLILELFADDLEERAALMIGDKLVLLPERVASPLGRALVSHSYIANIAWLAAAPSFHTMPRRMILPEQQRFFQSALKGLIKRYEDAGSAVIIMLLAPSGMPFCPENPQRDSRCTWLKEDLNLMARLMDDAAIPFLDLRSIWNDRPLSLIDVERAALKAGRLDIGLHPDALGHTYLAELLAAPSLEALGGQVQEDIRFEGAISAHLE